MTIRASGVLLHITSLPGPYGIGDLGGGAESFVDFLAAAGQSYWQFLPTCPGSKVFGGSPYMSLCAMAGNPLMISPDLLHDDGLLSRDDLNTSISFSEYLVDFDNVTAFKDRLLRKAFANMRQVDLQDDIARFASDNSWLEDYALFMSIRDQQGHKPWNQWPASLANRQKKALDECRCNFNESIEYYKFEQFCFYKQWQGLRKYANGKGIRLVGDLPIYVSFDSVDVWANQRCFELDKKTLSPTHVAGVPPDYFSETGQRWGNPLYRWKIAKKKNVALYDWWRLRFQEMTKTVDMLRIDHFRAFESFWQISAGEETAVNGRWIKGPGIDFFNDMADVLAGVSIIAEDLGIITPEVEKLRDDLQYPGMKILQFAFDSEADNYYLPHNFLNPNCVVYTGTHDNNTTLGWYLGADCSEESRGRARRYANSSGEQISWDFIRLAMSSVAFLAITPMQDVFGFGEDCRMNLPGTAEGNWRWRLASRFVNDDVASRLRDETSFYGRLPIDKEKNA